MPPILIVAYGNPLRSDDGIAWHAVDGLQNKFPDSEVEILRLHQLAPEVADAVQNRELVLFIDAACVDTVENGRPGEIRIREIGSGEMGDHRAQQFSHVYPPAKILTLAREIYQTSPKALVITVAGENFDHGDRLSKPVKAALPTLIAEVEQIIRARISKS